MKLRNYKSKSIDFKKNLEIENLEEITSSNADAVIKQLKKQKEKTNDKIHQGHRARLKSQFLENGITSLTDIQKLELLLFFAIPQKDTNPIAHKLLNKFGSLKNVFAADYLKLIDIDGIKENSALLISLVNAFSNYVHKPDNKDILNSSESTIKYAVDLFHNATVEQFYVVCLTKDGAVKKCVLLADGSVDQVEIQIRSITQLALDNKHCVAGLVINIVAVKPRKKTLLK